MFESTLPAGAPELIRASAFRRYVHDLGRSGEADTSSGRLSSLNPSLLQDLMRFEAGPLGAGLEVLDVLAACVRHGRALAIHLQNGDRVVTLTVFPVERLVHCPLPMAKFLDGAIAELTVLHVEPAILRPPGHRERVLIGDPERYAPLGPLLWELALRGSRGELLPEIAGPLGYRIAPGVDLRGLKLGGSMAAAIFKLKRQTTNLREIAEWTGFDRERAVRMLNGLYLQAGLIVSRSHPAATNDGWFGGSR
jgi:hypothetical protein